MPRLVLAYAGQHHNGHTLSTTDLSEVVATGNAIGEAPLTVGHVTGSAPQYGTVRNFSAEPYTNPLDGTSTTALYADVDVVPALAQAISGGFFRQRSIGLSRDPQGRLYPHHLAVLGATPPAVKGLPALEFAADETVASFAIADAPPATVEAAGPYSDTQRPLARLLGHEVDRVAAAAGTDRTATVAALAEAAGVAPATVEHVLAGEIPSPRPEWLRAFAAQLGLAEQTLLDAADFWYADAPRGAAALTPPVPPAPSDPVHDTTAPADGRQTQNLAADAAGTTAPAAGPSFSDTPEYRALRDQLDRANARQKADGLARLRETALPVLGATATARLVAFADALVPAGSADVEFADAGGQPRTADPLAELVALFADAEPVVPYGDALEFGDAPATGAEDVVAKARRQF